jgi:hypothetical protein
VKRSLLVKTLALAARNAQLESVVKRQHRLLVEAAAREAALLRLLDDAAEAMDRATNAITDATGRVEESNA